MRQETATESRGLTEGRVEKGKTNKWKDGVKIESLEKKMGLAVGINSATA